MTQLQFLKTRLGIVQQMINDGLDYGGPAPKIIYEEEKDLIYLISKEENENENDIKRLG